MNLDEIVVYLLQDRSRLLDAIASVVVLVLLLLAVPLFLWRGCTFRRNTAGLRDVRLKILKHKEACRPTMTTELCADGRAIRVRAEPDAQALTFHMSTDDALFVHYVERACPVMVDRKDTQFTIHVPKACSVTNCSTVTVKHTAMTRGWKSLLTPWRTRSTANTEQDLPPPIAIIHSMHGTRMRLTDENRPSFRWRWRRSLYATQRRG